MAAEKSQDDQEHQCVAVELVVPVVVVNCNLEGVDVALQIGKIPPWPGNPGRVMEAVEDEPAESAERQA